MDFQNASGQEIIDFFKGVEEIANKAHKDGLISDEVLAHANDVAMVAVDKLIEQIKGDNGAELEDAINKANLLEQKLQDVLHNDMQTISDLKAQVFKLQEQLNNSSNTSNAVAPPTAEVVAEVVAETIPQGVVVEDAVAQAEVTADPTPTVAQAEAVVEVAEVATDPTAEVVAEGEVSQPQGEEVVAEVTAEVTAEPTAESQVAPQEVAEQDEQSYAAIILTGDEPTVASEEDLKETETLDSDPS